MKAIIGRIYTSASHIYVIEVEIIELSPSLPILSGFSGLHELCNAQVAQPLSLFPFLTCWTWHSIFCRALTLERVYNYFLQGFRFYNLCSLWRKENKRTKRECNSISDIIHNSIITLTHLSCRYLSVSFFKILKDHRRKQVSYTI